jgi:hypothetical protein
MAKHPPNGNGHDVGQAMLQALRDINATLGRHETPLKDLAARVEGTNARLDLVSVRTEGALDQLNRRLENFLTGTVGSEIRDHRDRLARLEEKYERLESISRP